MTFKTLKHILVIVPAFNEQNNVAEVVSEIAKSVPAADILVVDDGSYDKTRLKAISVGAKVVSHTFNLGYGAALETGYLYAIKKNYDFVLQMDGDGQHLASELLKILSILENNEADIVIGDRNDCDYSHSIFRKIGQKLFSTVVYLLSGFHISDSTSGFQGLDKRSLRLFASGLFPHDYPDADVIMMSKFAGLRIKEVPVKMLNRIKGVSMHSGVKPLYYVFKMFLSLFIVRLNKRSLRRLSNQSEVSEEL
ncbi:MAG: glycosyltransferase family 2 protein [Pseudomonadota bacterium]